MEGTECWKVTTEYGRSACVTGCSSYSLTYKKGTVTRAKEGTLGVFCFKDLADAVKFAIRHRDKIVRVIGLGGGVIPRRISGSILTTGLDLFYKVARLPGQRRRVSDRPPAGTICFPAVEVMD